MINIGNENETVEFKISTSELKEALISICAMLNKHGKGIVYFGVNNSGDLIGQQIGKDTKRDISKKISEAISPTIYPIIDTLKDNPNVIYCEFRGNEKPYSCCGKFYIRSSDEDKKIDINTLLKLINHTDKSNHIFEKILSNETVDDVDENRLIEFMKKANDSGRITYPYTNKEEVMKKLNLYHDGFLNNAGRLLFSKNKPLGIKLAIFKSDEKDGFIDTKWVEGNIFDLIEVSLNYIYQNINIKAEIVGFKRIETPEIPLRAIREIVVNSFVHSSFDERILNSIFLTPTRLVIFNPGPFPSGYTPRDFAYNGMDSILRNPLIAKTLYYANEIESWARGFKRVYDECKENKIKTSFKEKDFGFEFTFYRNSLYPLSLKEKLYILLKEDNTLKSEELAKELGVSRMTVSTLIKELKNESRIERVGSNKFGYWKVK